MKEYYVEISGKALEDMNSIFLYIANQLQAPQTAQNQYDRIAGGIQSLRYFPERCKTVDCKWSPTLRRLLVNNYCVFYYIENDCVKVVRVLYSSADLSVRLKEML